MARNLAYTKSGKAVTKEEFEHFRNQLPIETWIMNGNREKIVAQTNELLRNEAFSAIAPFVREVGDHETVDLPDGSKMRLRDIVMNPHFNAPGEIPTGAPGEAQAINNKNIINPAPLTEEEQKRLAAGELLAPAVKGDRAEDGVTPEVKGVKSKFIEANPEFKQHAKTVGEQFAESVGAAKEGEVAVTSGDLGLIRLAQAGASGDSKAFDQLKERAQSTWMRGMREEEFALANFLVNELVTEYPDKYKPVSQE